MSYTQSCIYSNTHLLLTYLPRKMEQTECSETLAYKIQTPGNYPEGNIQHTEHGESLKSRTHTCFFWETPHGVGVSLRKSSGNGPSSGGAHPRTVLMAVSVFWTCCGDRCGLLQNKQSFTQIIHLVLSVLVMQGLLCVTLVSPVVLALHFSIYTKMKPVSKYSHKAFEWDI
jgi:hypothetical protein